MAKFIVEAEVSTKDDATILSELKTNIHSYVTEIKMFETIVSEIKFTPAENNFLLKKVQTIWEFFCIFMNILLNGIGKLPFKLDAATKQICNAPTDNRSDHLLCKDMNKADEQLVAQLENLEKKIGCIDINNGEKIRLRGSTKRLLNIFVQFHNIVVNDVGKQPKNFIIPTE